VGLSPDRDLRVYEGAFVWDAGYLEFVGDGMRYVGEQTHFVLARSDVRRIQLVSGGPRWRKTKIILIEWSDSATKQSGAFRFSCPAPSFSRDAKQAEKLYEKIVAWRDSCAPDRPVTPGPRPIFSEITSAPLQMGSWKSFISSMIFVCYVPIVFSVALPVEGRIFRGATAVVLAISGVIFATIPFWRKAEVFRDRGWPAA